MNDYQTIMNAVCADDLETLEEISQIRDDFPDGLDDFLRIRWLTNAIDFGSPRVVGWMLGKGANPGYRDKDGYSPLHSAIERERPDKYEVMRLLIESGADVDARGINDWTPAHMAAARNDLDALTILHAAGADFSIKTRIDHYATPLEEAVLLGKSPGVIEYLMSVTTRKQAGGPDRPRGGAIP